MWKLLVLVALLVLVSPQRTHAQPQPFVPFPTVAYAGAPVAFQVGLLAAPAGVTITWVFGDGTSATGTEVSHTYAEAGVFATAATFSRPDGSRAVVTSTLRVFPAGTPVLGCFLEPLSPCRAGMRRFMYPAGWNLVAGGEATVVPTTNGPLSTLRARDTSYEELPFWTVLEPGVGYWAYFDGPGEAWQAGPPRVGPVALSVPAGQFVLIGNPFTYESAVVSGADLLYTYDPATGDYTAATTLLPGQGAWAYRADAGTITLTPIGNASAS